MYPAPTGSYLHNPTHSPSQSSFALAARTFIPPFANNSSTSRPGSSHSLADLKGRSHSPASTPNPKRSFLPRLGQSKTKSSRQPPADLPPRPSTSSTRTRGSARSEDRSDSQPDSRALDDLHVPQPSFLDDINSGPYQSRSLPASIRSGRTSTSSRHHDGARARSGSRRREDYDNAIEVASHHSVGPNSMQSGHSPTTRRPSDTMPCGKPRSKDKATTAATEAAPDDKPGPWETLYHEKVKPLVSPQGETITVVTASQPREAQQSPMEESSKGKAKKKPWKADMHPDFVPLPPRKKPLALQLEEHSGLAALSAAQSQGQHRGQPSWKLFGIKFKAKPRPPTPPKSPSELVHKNKDGRLSRAGTPLPWRHSGEYFSESRVAESRAASRAQAASRLGADSSEKLEKPPPPDRPRRPDSPQRPKHIPIIIQQPILANRRLSQPTTPREQQAFFEQMKSGRPSSEYSVQDNHEDAQRQNLEENYNKMLSVDIPSTTLERYSVMFSGVLGDDKTVVVDAKGQPLSPDQPAADGKVLRVGSMSSTSSKLLARRQAQLERLKTEHGTIVEMQSEEADQRQAKQYRRMSSPQLSPSLSQLPGPKHPPSMLSNNRGTFYTDSSSRTNSLQRSMTSSGGTKSPKRVTFRESMVSSNGSESVMERVTAEAMALITPLRPPPVSHSRSNSATAADGHGAESPGPMSYETESALPLMHPERTATPVSNPTTLTNLPPPPPLNLKSKEEAMRKLEAERQQQSLHKPQRSLSPTPSSQASSDSIQTQMSMTSTSTTISSLSQSKSSSDLTNQRKPSLDASSSSETIRPLRNQQSSTALANTATPQPGQGRIIISKFSTQSSPSTTSSSTTSSPKVWSADRSSKAQNTSNRRTFGGESIISIPCDEQPPVPTPPPPARSPDSEFRHRVTTSLQRQIDLSKHQQEMVANLAEVGPTVPAKDRGNVGEVPPAGPKENKPEPIEKDVDPRNVVLKRAPSYRIETQSADAMLPKSRGGVVEDGAMAAAVEHV